MINKVNDLFEEIESVYGAVQVLVNNAGITQDGLLMRMDEQAWQRDWRQLDLSISSKQTCHERHDEHVTDVSSILPQWLPRWVTWVKPTMLQPKQGWRLHAFVGTWDWFTPSYCQLCGTRSNRNWHDGWIDERLINAMIDVEALGRLGRPKTGGCRASGKWRRKLYYGYSACRKRRHVHVINLSGLTPATE